MHNSTNALYDRLRVPTGSYDHALAALATGQQTWLILSGKMTAGKDTVAPELVDIVGSDVAMLRYGDLMRAELNPALDLLREWMGTYGPERVVTEAHLREIIAGEVKTLLSLTIEQARELVDVLAPEMHQSNQTLTASARTNGIRKILQYLGDEWRCPNDRDYWARAAALAALDAVNAGWSVILTGGRFLPDVEIPRAAGALVVRIDVTRQTQLDRLRSRDGLDPDEETLAALDHIGETELDDWPHFDVRVANDTGTDINDVIATVSERVFAMKCRRATRIA